MFRHAVNKLNSVAQVFTATPQPTEKISTANDTVSILTAALQHLYTAKAEQPYAVTNMAYKLIGSKPPEPTAKQVEEEEKALTLLRKLQPQFPKDRLNLILEAHIMLGTGCVKSQESTIKNAIKLLDFTPLSETQKKALLEVCLKGNQEDPDFQILGFLGYASKHNKINLVETLLELGANPGCRPLLEGEDNNSFDLKPIFFSVATNVIAWVDYRTSAQSAIPVELVSFDTSIKHIKHYLNAGFNINTTYKKQNILQHAYTANLSGDMHYHVHLIAHTVYSTFNIGKITERDYKIFCKTLDTAGLLKLFPILVAPYEKILNDEIADSREHKGEKVRIYKNDKEQNYYCLRSFLFNLIGLCAYESTRIKNDYISKIANIISSISASDKIITHKYEKLLESLNKLKKLQEIYINNDTQEKRHELPSQLQKNKNEIAKNVSLQRFVEIGKTTASTDWNAFLMMNELEVKVLNQEVYSSNPALKTGLK